MMRAAATPWHDPTRDGPDVANDLRVALVGYGLAGRHFHAPLIRLVDGLHVAAVVTKDPERADAATDDNPSATVLLGGGNVGDAKKNRSDDGLGRWTATMRQGRHMESASPRSGSIRWSTTGSTSRSTRAIAGSTRIAPPARRRRSARQQDPICGAHHPPSRPASWSPCQSERSQHKNRCAPPGTRSARASMSSSLRSARRKPARTPASKTDIGWGHQIRSYVLQPYQMVKDLRTGFHVSSSPDEVLDGDLDPFMEGFTRPAPLRADG